MQYGSITSTIIQNNPSRQVLRLRNTSRNINLQASLKPLRLRKREYDEMSNSQELTQEQVRGLRLNKLCGFKQHNKLPDKVKEELQKEYKKYQTRLFDRQIANFGPTPFQERVIRVEGDRTEALGVIRNYARERRLLNVIENQSFEMSLAQCRSLLRKRSNQPINENLIPNEAAIRQNIPEPINLLDDNQIRILILTIMKEQHERESHRNNEFFEQSAPKELTPPSNNIGEIINEPSN